MDCKIRKNCKLKFHINASVLLATFFKLYTTTFVLYFVINQKCGLYLSEEFDKELCTLIYIDNFLLCI